MRLNVNWRQVLKLASALFAAQVAVGFSGGLLDSSPSTASVALSHAVSLAVCTALFAFFAARQPSRPFLHAFAAFSIHLAAGFALSVGVSLVLPGLAETSSAGIVLELAVVIFALLVGTGVGVTLRGSAGEPADA